LIGVRGTRVGITAGSVTLENQKPQLSTSANQTSGRWPRLPSSMPRQARSGGWGGRAPHRDGGSPGQTLEVHGQPPFEAGNDHIIDIDCGRLHSQAIGELRPD
jgi:hypothetical protein